MSTQGMQRVNQYPSQIPKQEQNLPGSEAQMEPRPMFSLPDYKGSGKLKDKVAIITGADSGIGRSVAVLFAREGADIVCSYLNEHEDAKKTKACVEKEGRKCLLIDGDIGNSAKCDEIVEKAMKEFGHIDILVNNAAMQVVQEDLLNISDQQWDKTFRTNIYSYFYMARACLRYMKENAGCSILNCASVNAYKGNDKLIDYSTTKSAIVGFTRSLAMNLASKGIRVNGVAPGPIWTPLIPASFSAEKVEGFGEHVPMGRTGQPEEVATSFVFLASTDASYFTGQVLHPNGGYVVNA